MEVVGGTSRELEPCLPHKGSVGVASALSLALSAAGRLINARAGVSFVG